MLDIMTDWNTHGWPNSLLEQGGKIPVKPGSFLTLESSEHKGVQLRLTANKSSKGQTKLGTIFTMLQLLGSSCKYVLGSARKLHVSITESHCELLFQIFLSICV